MAIESDGVVISWHESTLPESVGLEMDRLYQNLYSSYAQFSVSGDLDDISAYVARTSDQKALAILVFRKERGKVIVLNSAFRISEQEIQRFATHIFGRFRSVHAIAFHALQTEIRAMRLPYHKVNFSEDVVLPLPDTVQAYLESLGKSMKKNVKYYSNKLRRNFPSFEFKVYEKDAIDQLQVLDIIKIKNSRIAGAAHAPTIEAKEIQRIVELVSRCGFVGVATIDGRVCGGSICYRIGDHVFGGVLAHDVDFDDFWLGMLCCYFSIGAAIGVGCKEYHFLWGRDEYKYRWLGVQRDLDNLIVYRSRTRQVLNCGAASRAALQGRVRQAKLWLLDPVNRDKQLTRMILKIRGALQKFKRPRLDAEGL